jgi:nucleoside-triphosphatase THEP1
MQPRLILLTGEQDAGKSLTCHLLMTTARAAGRDVAGVLSLGAYHQKEKIGYMVMDAHTEAFRPLAAPRRDDQPDSVHTQRWTFFKDALDWGNGLLEDACPCDILIVDELGPLELERGEGWQAGIAALDSRAYQVAVAVVRPSLLAIATERFAPCSVVQIASPAEKDAVVGLVMGV